MEIRHFLLILLAISLGRSINSKGCDLCLDGVCYEKTRLLSNYNISVNPVIAVDRTNHILYFDDYDDSTLKFLSLANNSVQSTNLHHVNCFTVDQRTQTLFVHSWDNLLYKYFSGSNHSYYYNVGEHLNTLYFNGKLYAWIGIRVYTLWLTQLTEIEALNHLLVSELVIDKRGDFYFCGCTSSITCHTFKLNAGSSYPFIFTNETYFIATDTDDNVYFIDSYETAYKRLLYVYRLNYDSYELEEVGLFDPSQSRGIRNVQFDRDNNLIITLKRIKNEDEEEATDVDTNDRVHHFKATSWHCNIRKQPLNEYMTAGDAVIERIDE